MEDPQTEISALLREICGRVAALNVAPSVSLGKSSATVAEPSTSAQHDCQESEMSSSLGGAVCVFYTKSPFSDFAHSPFFIDGRHFATLEHYFQIQMLYSFGMFRLAQKLLEIEDSGNFRASLRSNLKTMVQSGLFDEKMFAKWRKTNAAKLMRQGNRAKFQQNWTLRQQLLATGDRLLVYTNKNDFLLGAGMSEKDFLSWVDKNDHSLEDLLDMFSGNRPRPKGLGANALGVALMEARAESASSVSLLTEWRLHVRARDRAAADEELTPTQPTTAEPLGKEPTPTKTQPSAPVVPVPPPPTNEFCAEVETSSAAPSAGLAVDRLLIATRSDFMPREAVKVPGENRIVYKGGAAKEIRDAQERKEKLRQWSSAQAGGKAKAAVVPNSATQNQSVLDRLRSLQIERPMVNPFSYTGSKPDSTADTTILKEGAAQPAAVDPAADLTGLGKSRPGFVRNAAQSLEDQQAAYARAIGNAPDGALSKRQMKKQLWCIGVAPLYPLEPGEICPPGLTPISVEDQEKIATGDVMAGPASIKRPPVIHRSLTTQARPAALPNHLLHHLPRPGLLGDESIQFPQGAVGFFDSRHTERYKLPFPLLAPLLEQSERISSTRLEPWSVPENPLKAAIEKAKSLPADLLLKKAQLIEAEKVRRKALRRKAEERIYKRLDEGADPRSRQKRRPDVRSLDDELALGIEADIFSFGMEATLDDLQVLGYIPPPIRSVTGDPSSNMRNKGHRRDHWMANFDSAEEALKHHANRWCRGGRLGVTGELEDNSSEDDIDELLANFASSSSSDTDAEALPAMNSMGVTQQDEFGMVRPRKRRRRVETKVVFVDTSAYKEYVRWYQHVHGISSAPAAFSPPLDTDFLRRWFQSYSAAIRPYYGLDWSSADQPDPYDVVVNSDDAWLLSQWQAANSEARQQTQSVWTDHRQMINEAAGAVSDGVSISAKPVTYQYVFEPEGSDKLSDELKKRKKDMVELQARQSQSSEVTTVDVDIP